MTFKSAKASYTSTVAAGVNNPFTLNELYFSGTLPGAVFITGNPLLFTGAGPGIAQSTPATVTVQNTLQIDGLTTYPSGNAGAIILAGKVIDVPGHPGGSVLVNGNAPSNARLILTGSQNTYSRGTTVNNGAILNFDRGALGTGPLTLNDGATIGPYTSVNSLPDLHGQIIRSVAFAATGVPVVISGGSLTVKNFNPGLGRWSVAPPFQIVSTVAFFHGVQLLDDVNLTVSSFNNSAPLANGNGKTSDNQLVVSNLVSTDNLTLTGGGILQLIGANPKFTGNVTVNQGTLYVNNSVINGTVTVNGGGLIKGTGKVGTPPGGVVAANPSIIQTGGRVRPGDDPGTLTFVSGLAINGGELYVDLEGTNGVGSASGFSQIQVTGGTTLSNATLTLSLDYTPGSNDVFYLIDNLDTNQLSGDFTNLCEVYDPASGETNRFVAAVDNLTGQVYKFQVGTTGDAEGGDPGSLYGNDLAIFNAQATTNFVTLPPPSPALYPLCDGNVAITGVGVPAQTNILQATPSLSPATWTSIATNTADMNGLSNFEDLNATNFPMRFYRIQAGD